MAPTPGEDLNYPLTVAGIVCYSRPFTANEPHGALPKRYTRNLEQYKKEFHDKVLEARHEYFAHTDLNNRKAFIYPSGSLIAKETSNLHSSGLSSALSTRLYNAEFFNNLQELSSQMHYTVKTDIEAILEELYGSMALCPGKFRLKLDNGL